MKNKVKNLVSIILAFTFVFLFPSYSKAEKVSTLPNCIGSICFKKPVDGVISSDSSFALIVDSQSLQEGGTSFKKFVFNGSEFIGGEIIPLIQKSTNAPSLKILLSNNNKKAVVYEEPSGGGSTFIQVVDLSNNSIKQLNSITASGLQIRPGAFLDSEGKTLVASTLDAQSPEIIFVDIDSDSIVDRLSLFDVVQSISVSPSFKNIVFTFNNVLAQSVVVRNVLTGTNSTLTIDPALAFLVDDFLSRVDFDLTGDRAVLSSLGGNFVLHFLDIKNNKLISKILDKSFEGVTLSTLSVDGKTSISAGNISGDVNGFTLYKSSITKAGLVSISNTKSFDDGEIVLDLDITPDQSKLLILVSKNQGKKLIVLNLQDLSLATDLEISSDNNQDELILDPNGRYALTLNNINESSVSLITEFNPGPVLRKIIPGFGFINSNTPFTILGFLDPLRFSNDLKVCFRNNLLCSANTTVSKDGKIITGTTPKFADVDFEDILLIAKPISSEEPVITRYVGLFPFLKPTSIVDNFPPEIIISAPLESQVYNTRRIVVLGKVDGTGSEVKNVLVNGKPATLSSQGLGSLLVSSFFGDVQFDKDGTFEVKITTEDTAGNIAEKTIKVKIDTAIPKITVNVEQVSSNQFKITGTADGTGSNVSSILVNSIPVEFTKSEVVAFTAITNTTPIIISLTDNAGNKNELKISNPLTSDKLPPVITTLSPQNGDIFTGDNADISVSFTVTDDSSTGGILFNATSIPLSPANQYSQDLMLKPGENLIFIEATDTNGNESSESIKVTYIPSELPAKEEKETAKEQLDEKKVVNLPSEIKDLNQTLIDTFTDLGGVSGNLVDIASTFSVEISNPPPIPEGDVASIEIPEVVGLEKPEIPAAPPEIPKGFAFATEVLFANPTETTQLTAEEQNTPSTAILVDSTGRAFIVGFAFLNKPEDSFDARVKKKHYRFQTTNGEPLELITTFTVPTDAAIGDATVSILSGNKSLAIIPLRIASSNNVKVGRKAIAKPRIQDPVVAVVKKSTKQLVLRIKGKNFVSKVATIDGKIERAIGKSRLLTLVTFKPNNGINIKSIKVVNKKNIIVNAELSDNVKAGEVLFNVITPKGSDIGVIVFPDSLVDGKLEASSNVEDVLLSND